MQQENQEDIMRRLLAAPCALCVLLALPSAAATDVPGTADRLTAALVAMGEAHVGDPVLAAWLGQQERSRSSAESSWPV
jgi:hypothetical protein